MVALSLTVFGVLRRNAHSSVVMASDLAPTRAPHHPAPPRATTYRETTPPPGNGAVGTRAGWWARRHVVARGEVGGGWALVGARPHGTPLDAWVPENSQGESHHTPARSDAHDDVNIVASLGRQTIHPVRTAVVDSILDGSDPSIVSSQSHGIVPTVLAHIASHQASSTLQGLSGIPGIDPHTSSGAGHKLSNTDSPSRRNGVRIKKTLLIDLPHKVIWRDTCVDGILLSDGNILTIRQADGGRGRKVTLSVLHLKLPDQLLLLKPVTDSPDDRHPILSGSQW